ncbi:response regulator [Methylorubrum extorquens]
MTIRVLLVEDDEFKASDISKSLEETLQSYELGRASSVTSALRSISYTQFDLIVLDMSLPTFDLSGPGGGGSPQGQGGIEVMRLARRLKARSKIIVVTQYPDIELDGKQLHLSDAAAALSKKFELDVIACLPYQFDATQWRVLLKGSIFKHFPTDLHP